MRRIYIVIEKVNESVRYHWDIYTKGYSIKQGNEVGSGPLSICILTHLFHSDLLHLKKLKNVNGR